MCYTNSMKIRTSDDKGRIHINEKGKPYSVYEDEQGVITMYPVQIPEPRKGDTQTLRAVYVRVGRTRLEPDLITIQTEFGGFSSPTTLAKEVSRIAKENKIPVVVYARGMGQVLADAVQLEGVETILHYGD